MPTPTIHRSPTTGQILRLADGRWATSCRPDCRSCDTPVGTVLDVVVDATAMIPTEPVDGWHTTPPVQAGDWHTGPWVAHPETIFINGVSMPYESGFGFAVNCDTPPDTIPTGQPADAPVAPPLTPLSCDPGGTQYDAWDYAIGLQCDGDGTYTVTALGSQMDDLLSGPHGPYEYVGSVSGVSLACVAGRPTGTVVVPMTWDANDSAFNPAGVPQDCGSLTVVFS